LATGERSCDVTYVLIAKWTAKEGEEENVRAALEQLAGPTRAEPGCLMWQPQVDAENPRVFVIYEQYVDEAALGEHSASEHFKRIAIEDAIPRLESRERAFYETFAEPGAA
jgi:quinol monooxygenase YgiN